MARRKVILFLVEGTSELTALVKPFASYYSNRARVDGEAFYCDVTTISLFPRNSTFRIRSNVKETVRSFVLDAIERGKPYRWQDLQEIVHIVDLDGAFIPDARVVQDDTLDAVSYSAASIETPNRDQLIERNSAKSKALRSLVEVRALKAAHGVSVPYHVMFMSRNLEHALFGIERELRDDEKERLSQRFAEQCERDTAYFIDSLKRASWNVPTGYKESWEYIQEGVHSLERGSNVIQLVCPGFVKEQCSKSSS